MTQAPPAEELTHPGHAVSEGEFPVLDLGFLKSAIGFAESEGAPTQRHPQMTR